jgi:hypothetical protein
MTPKLATDPYYRKLEKLLIQTAEEGLFAAIVNAPFHNPVRATDIDLGIVVFLLVNLATGTIDRIALSDTEQARGAVNMSEKPFHHIKIPVGYHGNIIANTIDTGRPHHTADWQYLFAPDLSPQAARFNQAGAGIECSYVYPLKARDGGALIFSFFQPLHHIGEPHKAFMKAYCALVTDRLRRLQI